MSKKGKTTANRRSVEMNDEENRGAALISRKRCASPVPPKQGPFSILD